MPTRCPRRLWLQGGVSFGSDMRSSPVARTMSNPYRGFPIFARALCAASLSRPRKSPVEGTIVELLKRAEAHRHIATAARENVVGRYDLQGIWLPAYLSRGNS